MSRLIIKNLPTFATPDTLRKHFSQTAGPGGNITDIKVSNRPDGTSRRFGFVGFKTQEEAQKAKQWFDRTFIGGAKISVDFSEGAKDAPTPRPNKRRRMDGEAKASSQPIPEKAADANPSPKKDSKLEEFMNVMKPKRGPAWANDAATPQPILPQASSSTGPSSADAQAAEDEECAPENPEEQGELSDMEWLRRRMTQKVADDVPEEKVFEQSDDEDATPSGQLARMEVDGKPKQSEPPKDPTMETILQTGRLFLRNLAFSCTKDELQELFERFGTISQIHIPVDPSTSQPKGMAYVSFAQASSAMAAYKTLDKTSFQGRLLHILGAVDRRGFEVVEAEGKKKSLKDERADKKKKAASKEFNWSMLYMNSDAVASSIADRMSIPKTDILNAETGSNAAVKLALAETHIIQETKLYLESQGVDLSSFGTLAGVVDGGPVHHSKRSDTTILVKNIPYGTTSEQIEELFKSYGNLMRVLVPPAGTIAIVEFEKADEARQGFRGVAYRRLGNSVIYLEKGPVGMWLEGFDVEKARTAGTSTSTSSTLPVVRVNADADEGEAATEDQSVQSGSTLYVKNLSFNTTQERLAKVFTHLPNFSFARIQTKPDPKGGTARLSMGYGFIGFKDKESARKALKSVHGFILDGHALSVSFAGRGVEEPATTKDEARGVTSSKSRTTKMLVKNVPFEATKKDIRELFSAHGQLKSVRLPKKFDARSRGFAFLEFVSRREAENAYNALRHTHLLGRHLVLEWAEEGEQDLEVLRKKAGAGFSTAKDMPGRKRKLEFMQKGDEDTEPLEE